LYRCDSRVWPYAIAHDATRPYTEAAHDLCISPFFPVNGRLRSCMFDLGSIDQLHNPWLEQWCIYVDLTIVHYNENPIFFSFKIFIIRLFFKLVLRNSNTFSKKIMNVSFEPKFCDTLSTPSLLQILASEFNCHWEQNLP